MEPQDLGKCANCGAGLQPENADDVKCPYCGSVFPLKDGREVKVITAEPNVVIPEKPEERLVSLVPGEDNSNGCGIGLVLFFTAVVFIFIVIGVNKSQNSHGYGSVDSVAVDTVTKRDTATTNTVDANVIKEEKTYISNFIEALSAVKVDKVIFKKLYRNARKVSDQFSNKTFIYDKTSPRYVNYNGVYAYINKMGNDLELRFCTQYVSDDWLFIESMTINTDGKNSGLSPEFKRDNGNGEIWEWSDDAASYEDLQLLAKISAAKKAKIRYDGDKYYKVVKISAAQQLALKRQLQIFKGLLLKYDK